MTLALTVDEPAWRAHLDRFADGLGDHLIPVVKGNGYGFGRDVLFAEVRRLGVSRAAVGTIYEVPTAEVTGDLAVTVLTPTLDPLAEQLPASVTLTVGSAIHAKHLAECGFSGQVVIKLASSMRRYGCSIDELATFDLNPVAYSIHPPLAGDDEAHVADVERWLPHLDPLIPVAVSHVSREAFDRLSISHPARRFDLRSGTALWHGDKSMLHLGAMVLDVRPVVAGDTAGYQQSAIDADGSLIVIGAGTAHGVSALPDGRSPFHFANQRLGLLEPPHMHTSMAVTFADQPTPGVGDVVDVQRPLTQTSVDRIVWVR